MFSGRSLSGIACCGPARANPQTRASGGRVAEHRLDFHVLVETELAPLAAVAAALHAAERRLEVKAAVDRDPAGAHALGDRAALFLVSSAERRVGKEWVRMLSSGGSAFS